MPKWCKMVLELSTECMPRPHLVFFTQPDCLNICTFYAWLELAMWRVCQQQSKLPHLGGSNGGDDLIVHPVHMYEVMQNEYLKAS